MCKTASTFFAKFSAMSSGGTVQYFFKRSSNFTRGGNYLKMFVKCCSNVFKCSRNIRDLDDHDSDVTHVMLHVLAFQNRIISDKIESVSIFRSPTRGGS